MFEISLSFEVLIDIKHPVRVGYSFIADDIGASRPPYTTLLYGSVQLDGTYKWVLQQFLKPKIPLTVWIDTLK